MGGQHSGGPPVHLEGWGSITSCPLDSRVGGASQLESDALHFNQKSSMSLSYLALETGQSRAAVSCSNTLLAAAALLISRPLFSSPLRLSQTAFSPSCCSVGRGCGSVARVKMSSLGGKLRPVFLQERQGWQPFQPKAILCRSSGLRRRE